MSAITGVTVIDVRSGRRLADQTVVIRGPRILVVGRAPKLPPSVNVVDGRGGFLIPGLWDMHVHAAQEGRPYYYWPLFVTHGVTGVRNMGGWLDSLLAYRAMRDTMRGVAPRVIWSSPILDGVQSYPHTRVARTPAEGRAFVDSMKTLGFALVKTYSNLTRATYFAVMDEARRIHMEVSGHVPNRVTPLEAAAAGQRTIEHMSNEIEYCTPGMMDPSAVLDSAGFVGASPPAGVPQRVTALALRGPDHAICRALVTTLVDRGVWHTPTLVANRSVFSLRDTVSADDERRHLQPASIVGGWDGSRARELRNVPPVVIDAMHSAYTNRTKLAADLAAAGGGILAGSDVSSAYGLFPGASLQEELLLLVKAGLTPLQALQAATLNPARYLRATDSLGTVAPGRLADLVLLDGDPLLDIRNVTRIRAVWSNGRYLDRRMLDTLAARAMSEAARR